MKNDGIGIDSHSKLKEIFEDTLKQIEKNPKLRVATEKAKENAKFYDELDEIDLLATSKTSKKLNAYTTAERTFEAAKRLLNENGGKVAVLNFANSVRPGGGVRGGSSAQEESLCRCSNLYPTINQSRFLHLYYYPNVIKNNLLGTDAIIYSPDVTVFKSDTDYPEMLPEDKWYNVDVITCAAPCLPYGGGEVSEDELYEIHLKRAQRILDVAAANGAERLVLGAFGCGAFNNDPKIVAKAFYDAFMDNERFCEFKEVVFAIYHQEDETENFREFVKEFPKR